jgi:hypothetical protein
MESKPPEGTPSAEAKETPPVGTNVGSPNLEKPGLIIEKVTGQRPGAARVVLYSYPELVYSWPVILLGFALWFTDRFGWLSPKTEAWIYAIAFVVVLLTMGTDVSRNMAVFWIAVIAAVSFLILWLRGAKGILFFDKIGQFLADLAPSYSADFGMMISMFLLVIYVIMLAAARINDKWVFSQNEIEHYVFFRGTSSLGRGAKGVSASYNDFFELALLLAGDVEVRTAQGNRVLARMRNVPFLFLRMRKIDRILASYATTTGVADEESSESVEEEVL